MRIGIRREDKNEWEARVPLIPEDVGRLVQDGIDVWLQPSSLRIFPDDAYRKAGAVISEDLSSCPIILAVKEIPINFFEPEKTYMFFSHVIKGQQYNMPMLKRMMELKCNLLDYEVVTDDQNRRLIFFGRHAGLAGMIDTLWAFGQRLESEGKQTPFGAIKMAHEYESLDDAKSQIAEIAGQVREQGIPDALSPLIFGFAGYGNVSQGAQEIFDLFDPLQVDPAEVADSAKASAAKLMKVVFKEEHLVEPIDPFHAFELQDYYDHPEKYRSRFEKYLPHLSVLVNCIFWDTPYPRLVTFDWLKRAWSGSQPPALKVIGDISCDIEGSIQCTVKVTDPGNPVYVYDPIEGNATDGWKGTGPVIMAVDNLPCELAKEASEFFSRVLYPFIPQLISADYDKSFEDLSLPDELHRATLLLKGELTPKYQYIAQYL
jgi:alpha-aminoadipic semialdehyde synthase